MPHDVVCLSHLRWDFVFQRPNHLMVQAARDRRVFFVEEPIVGGRSPSVDLVPRDGVTVVTPRIPAGLSAGARRSILARLVDDLVRRHAIERPWAWYTTPAPVDWTGELDASVTVYDRMDDLQGFRGADPRLGRQEQALLARADVVFTGGQALYEATRHRHPNVHAFPSSVDVHHFRQARTPRPDPADQAAIARPRLGWFGVVDERFDRPLVEAVAAARPDWQLVLVGPMAKLAPHEIPTAPNIHWLGIKAYDDLPGYLAGWDVAIMPFARNASTRYISPTKTPEYLAGGRPVVATSVRDVVEPWERLGLVRIADTPQAFIAAVEAALVDDRQELANRVDRRLTGMSWTSTWQRMAELAEAAARDAGVLTLPGTGTPASVPASVPNPGQASTDRIAAAG